jgi:hypothetical protein
MTCSGGIYPPQSVQIYAPSGGCRCIAVAVNVCSTGHCAARRVYPMPWARRSWESVRRRRPVGH